MTFDPTDPPHTYKAFKKSIIKSVESLEIEEDEDWPIALFVVTREHEGVIKYSEEILQEHEEINEATVLMQIFPAIIKAMNARFFALVLPGEISDGQESQEIITILSGDLINTDICVSKIDREEEIYADLDPWEKQEIMNFTTLATPYRRSVVLQG